MAEAMFHLLILSNRRQARRAIPIFGLQELHFHTPTVTISLGRRCSPFNSIVWNAALDRILCRVSSSLRDIALRNVVSALEYASWRLRGKLHVLDTQILRFYRLDLVVQGSMRRFSGIQMISRLRLIALYPILLDMTEHRLLIRDCRFRVLIH